MDLSRGQMQETANSRNIDHGLEDYLERIYFKTASLFSTSGESGSILSGAPESTVQILKTYSEKIGLAFQVVDDVLDITGTEQEIGKPVGSDLLNGVITLPTIYAMEDTNCRKEIERFLEDPSNSALHSEIVKMVKSSDVKERSYEYAQRLIEEAGYDHDSTTRIEETRGAPAHPVGTWPEHRASACAPGHDVAHDRLPGSRLFADHG